MTGNQDDQNGDMVIHRGGCHCGAIRFECDASPEITAFQCNCSVCIMKQNVHFMVPAEHFRLLQGEDKLTTYQFNTNTAKHLFCSICGVQSFYLPRSHPTCRAVTIYCIDPGTLKNVSVEQADGKDWEAWHAVYKAKQQEVDS
ncbi:putative integron gene cassette protein [Coccomyxa subellipsoidea C-169]|uniref:Integron gene cassette protein n=1 Tax=Coccomyxa subellipsoidea (strain C-169) TaxID=574566 RepID=I0YZZ0_COCSC|nr:putative integron gene cassette protein [Coccomyxa subellipsoidea C-169]EIE23959.1 putative integron gene cassette protein [Coccomyxa subellipsoidea C-169]|eukprot:XP_005648503.1 putative integron gene cassette protein [Coccomyxa subellipsoidea C-169]